MCQSPSASIRMSACSLDRARPNGLGFDRLESGLTLIITSSLTAPGEKKDRPLKQKRLPSQNPT